MKKTNNPITLCLSIFAVAFTVILLFGGCKKNTENYIKKHFAGIYQFSTHYHSNLYNGTTFIYQSSDSTYLGSVAYKDENIVEIKYKQSGLLECYIDKKGNITTNGPLSGRFINDNEVEFSYLTCSGSAGGSWGEDVTGVKQ
jgi:hypothetical protein